MIMRANRLIGAWAMSLMLLTAQVGANGGGSVTAARDLYASAAYDDALAMLNTLTAGPNTSEERQAIDLYRILCFVALGRAADADRAIDALLTSDPLYRPSAGELPPRMQSAFSTARARLLPPLIQQHYASAKAAFDRQDFAAAVPSFRQVLDELADPDISPAASQPPLSDLRMLATGFHELSAKALAPPPPVVVVAPIPEPLPVTPPRDFRRLYSADDQDAQPPTIVRQVLPPFNGTIPATVTGAVEVIVNTAGDVEAAAIRIPVHLQYDRIVLAAARRWKYQAATVDGVPVKYAKVVRIVVTPEP